ncbi:MAG: alkyl/aryl-sulfatase [Gracilibacteraceae bacterium]|nr:alkyl/aryl-sulfatase [Gracilibacteraceae bacterium]
MALTNEQKLIAHNRDFPKPGMKEITDKVFVVTGLGGNNALLVEGESSGVLVDALSNETEGLEAAAWLRSTGRQPVKTVIFTHSHPDHTSGAAAIAPEANLVIARKPSAPVYGHSSALNGIGAVRGMRQWGDGLSREEIINIGTNPFYEIRQKAAPLNPSYVYNEEELAMTVDGVSFVLYAADGETDDQTFVWFPERKILACGDNYYHTFPNTSPIRGGQYRNVSRWIDSLDLILRLEPEHLVPGHTHALAGKEEIQRVVTDYRDGVRHIFTETLEGMNRGLTPDQLVETVALPDHLRECPQLQEFYGKVSWMVRGIFSGYLGWFDGNPTHLETLPCRERALRTLDLSGGAAAVLAAAKTAAQKSSQNDAQWAAELCDILMEADQLVEEAKSTKAAALRLLARATINSCARHYYFCAAKDLEEA